MSIVLFTHTDLDGAGCSILTNLFFSGETITTHYCNYDTIDNAIETFLDTLADTKQLPTIIIADIGPSKSTLQQLDKAHKSLGFDLVCLDHHGTKASDLRPFKWATFNPTQCATKMLRFWLKTRAGERYTNSPETLALFCDAVDAWDRWIEESPYRQRGKNINALFYFMGMESFVEEFSKDLQADNDTFCKKNTSLLGG